MNLYAGVFKEEIDKDFYIIYSQESILPKMT